MKKFLERIFFKQAGEGAKEDAGLFVALFTLFFAIAYALLSGSGRMLHFLAAQTSAVALKLLGIVASVVPDAGDGFPHLLGEVRGAPFEAQINDLCGGAVELALISAIVLASRDRSLRNRALGVLGGFLAFAAFNPLRIALTLNAVGSWALPLLHDFLFRISLVVLVVGYYAVWYYATPAVKKRFFK